MLSLVALVVVLVATAASALTAESHEWYTGLRSPSGAPCCNERDCRSVANRINRDTGREEIQANGAWYPIEYDKELPFSSPDGGYHAFWSNAAGRPDFASWFPAWHPSRSRRVWLESPLTFSAQGEPAAPFVASSRRRAGSEYAASRTYSMA
jgi:hypothetical protein